MARLKPMPQEARGRINSIRDELMKRDYECFASGKFGLPSFDMIEAHVRKGRVIYLVYDRKIGGWDILVSIDEKNNIPATLKALDKLIASNS